VRTQRTILIVEDEAPIREIVAVTLTKAGYAVISAKDPEEAYTRLGQPMRHVDLLFTDIEMPQQSGTDFASEFLQLMPKTKIIFATGSSQLHHRDALSRVPYERILEKPYSAEDLRNAVQQVLDCS
jgi:CheY-like chemotaxis protein